MGYIDLVVNVSSLNFLSLLKMPITGNFEQKFNFYLFENGLFTESPVYTYTVQYPIKADNKSKSILVGFTHEFNSDGTPDVFLKEKKILVRNLLKESNWIEISPNVSLMI